MKAVAVIPAILGSSALMMSAQSAPLPCAPPPPITEVVRELDAMRSSVPPSTDPTEIYATLRGAEIFQSYWLKDNKDQLQRVATIRHGLEDVLLARWTGPPNYTRIKNIEIWDGALYELVIFEVDAGAIASEESIRQTLLYIMKPPPEKLRTSGPPAQALEDGFGYLRPKTSDTQRWEGLILRSPTRQVGGYDEELFTVHEIEGRVFLVFDFGKRAGGYVPWPQSIYLGNRFPSLSELVRKWPQKRLLRELATRESHDGCLFADEFRLRRDDVLVAELVRRDLDPDEFREVMDSPYGRDLLVPALDSAHQTERYAALIIDALRRYEALPDVNHRIQAGMATIRSHLADLIGALPRRGGADFSDVMVQLIASNHEAEAAMNYLDWRFVYNSNQVPSGLADRLAKATVPAEMETKKDRMVAILRAHDSAH